MADADLEASVVSRASSRHPCSGSVWGPEDNLHKQGLSCDSYVLHVANQTASGQFSCLHLPSWCRSAGITDPSHCIRLPYVGSSDQCQACSAQRHLPAGVWRTYSPIVVSLGFGSRHSTQFNSLPCFLLVLNILPHVLHALNTYSIHELAIIQIIWMYLNYFPWKSQ